MTMFAEPLLAGGEERYGEREYQQQQQQQHQYSSHMEKGGRGAPYQEAEAEDREVKNKQTVKFIECRILLLSQQ